MLRDAGQQIRTLGRSWPLCNGRFIHEQATATLIEFSHRAVTGVEGILVAGGAIDHRNRQRALSRAGVLHAGCIHSMQV